MTNRFFRLAVFLVVFAFVASAACSRRTPPPAAPAPAPEQPAEAPAPPPPPPPPPPPAPSEPAPLTEDELFAQKTLEQLNAERPLGDVYFEYDDSSLSDDARATLQKNAEWMRRWSSTRITIEGHTDERGTAEYNLALGERRATAARNYMVSLGIAADRILATSLGEEAPVCRTSDEGCWRQNRRAHNVITAK